MGFEGVGFDTSTQPTLDYLSVGFCSSTQPTNLRVLDFVPQPNLQTTTCISGKHPEINITTTRARKITAFTPMSSQSNRPLRIELIVSASRPELLEGLDVWLRLGLLSDSQVKRISQTYLSCPLPEVVVTPTLPVRRVAHPREVETPIPTPSLSPLSGIWQSFQDELSVRWLLFLGVFLVVVSSGVLAATQWRNFPAAGQYGVLWGYTIIFWGIGIWARNKSNLKLTSQTLELVALLLVPVNFWAMDSFGLWRYFWEWIVVIIAACSLTSIILLNQGIRGDSSRFTSRTLLILCLSYLHWGWHLSGMPLLAVYLGVISTTIFLPKSPIGERGVTGELVNETCDSNGNVSASAYSILPNAPTGSSIVIYALIVLLARGIFIFGLPIEQLGLAIAICGWLLARLGKPPEREAVSSSSFGSQVWDGIGGGLLLIGWLVCIKESFPFQATMVSGLALSFFAQRLEYFSLRRDLAAIFLIGLQSLFLLWRLIPSQLQEIAIAVFTQLTHSSSNAFASFALFPYVIIWVGLTDWLYRREKFRLARFGEWLTLMLGVTLTVISTFSPTTQSLNLLLSTITLAIVNSRRLPVRVSLVYLTHITGLLTVFSIIYDWFPHLSQVTWATILLILMVAEWSIATMGCFWKPKPSQIIQNTAKNILPIPNPQSSSQVRGERQEVTIKTPNTARPIPYSPFPESCWYIGFILAGISYMLLWNETFTANFLIPTTSQQFGLLWLLTPLTLTGVAMGTSGNQSRRKEASWWSIIALIMWQFLTLPFPGVRLISLGVATGMMWFNTRYLKDLAPASINIGFGLSYVAMLLWEGIPGLGKLSGEDWFLAGAIAIIALWLLQKWLIQRQGTLAALYAQASDNWAMAISALELFLLTLHSSSAYSSAYQDIISSSWQYPTASILIGIAILFRSWKEPTESGFYCINLAFELAIAEAILLVNGSTLSLGIANIILGLVTVLLTDWLLQRETIPSKLIIHLQGLPLLYATLGIALRLVYFTPYTGLLTLGAALTFIGVGCRYSQDKTISYLGIAGISIAWYELVIYQMLQTPGGSLSDGLTILAGLAVAIAIIYRLAAWFWQSRRHSHILNFRITEIETTAHIHWVIGSILILLAATTSLGTSPKLRGAGIAISWILALYALIQGRYPQPRNAKNPPPSPSSDLWVYLGLTEVAITGMYARLTWTQLSILDPWRLIVASAFAIFLYQIPWWRWGWNVIPWQRYAIVSPLLTVLTIWLKGDVISDLNLFAIASFYGWVAKRQVNLRWTYFSLFFIDWAIARSFDRLELTDPLWNATLIGLSLLYIAQIDPGLKTPSQRQTRHYLYLLGSGIICVVALFYHQDTGLIPAIIGIIAIFAGLGLRIRAFLFIGTATFLLTTFYQLVVLSFRYPFSKWVIGLMVGILFISIAANFERRREQIISFLQNWVAQLNNWA